MMQELLTEEETVMGCPRCGQAESRKNGKDRRGNQVYECTLCARTFTALTDSPFSGYRFPPDVIALAVRSYLRYRLSDADVCEWLAERGVQVDRSTVYDWVQLFAPLYQEAARPHRHRVGRRWAVDETYVKVAGVWQYVYRAIDDLGQVIDVFVSETRDAAAAASFFCRALESTGVTPRRVTTDKAAAYPPALAAILPEVDHETGKMLQQAIERDQQHLKGRYASMRGFKTGRSAQVFWRAHGFARNLSDGFYHLGSSMGDPREPRPPLLMRAWDALTARLLAR